MIRSPETPRQKAGNELRFTRLAVVLLLLGSLAFGAIAGAAASLLISRARPQQTQAVPASAGAVSNPTSAIQAAEPFTVAITLIGAATGDEAPPASTSRQPLGTGVVLNLEGYILTTGSVLGRYDQVQVVFYDGSVDRATLVAPPDPDTGLAVLKVNKTVPAEPTFAPHTGRDVGEPVVALGTSMDGLNRTVGTGVVAAIGHTARLSGQPVDNLIQTDARPPEGAAGSPLVNMQGQLVGLTVAHQPDSGWSLVLPAETARGIARRLINSGVGPRASLGINYETVTPQTAQLRGLTQVGAYITFVAPRSPAAKAGLRPGDVIFSLDGKAVSEEQTFESLLAAYRPGQRVKLQYVRNDRVLQATAVLARKVPPGATPGPQTPTP